MSTPGKNSRRNKIESSQSEPEVPVQVPASSSRKGKRQPDLSTDLQPSSKKSYYLRRRTPLSEEEVSQLEEGGINEGVENVKETAEDIKVFSEGVKEVSQLEEGGINEEVESVKETAEDIKVFSEGTKEGCQQEKGIDEEIEDVNETAQDNDELFQDDKEAQGQEIENVIEIAQDSNEVSQDDKVAQRCQQIKEGICEKIENAKETAEGSKELSQDIKEVQGYLEEATAEELVNVEEDTPKVTNQLSTKKYKKRKGHLEEETTAEELVNVEDDTPKVSNQLSTKKRKKRKSSSSTMPKIPVAAGSKILFVGNLPYSVDDDNMLKFFEDVGSVVDIRMAKRIDGSMKGFCHVTFETEAAAKKAMDKNGEILGGRNVKLDFAKELRKKDAENGNVINRKKDAQNCTVLVRGFEKNQEEEDVRKSLMKHFGNCGGIKTVRVPKDISLGCFIGDAFIEFEDSGALSKAVELCGSDLGNCKLFVKAAGRKKVRRNIGKRHRKKHSKKKAAIKHTKEVCQ